MNALMIWQAMTQVSVEPSSLRFTLDVAQIVVLGGLVWRLSDMNSRIRSLTDSIDEFKEDLKRFGETIVDLISRVAELEGRDSERRNRRHDDTPQS